MSQQPIVKKLTIREGESPKLMVRVEIQRGVPAIQSTFGSLTYSLFDVRNEVAVTPAVPVATGTLVVATSIFDIMQTNAIDPDWIEDDAQHPGIGGLYGCNFKWQVPASLFVMSGTGVGKFRLEVNGVPAAGENFVIGWWLIDVWPKLSA